MALAPQPQVAKQVEGDNGGGGRKKPWRAMLLSLCCFSLYWGPDVADILLLTQMNKEQIVPLDVETGFHLVSSHARYARFASYAYETNLSAALHNSSCHLEKYGKWDGGQTEEAEQKGNAWYACSERLSIHAAKGSDLCLAVACLSCVGLICCARNGGIGAVLLALALACGAHCILLPTQPSQDLFVVFRGTWTHDDVLQDFKVLNITAPVSGVNMHQGFFESANASWQYGLNTFLTPAKVAEVNRVHFIGHSLGGAVCLALLGSGLLPNAPEGKYVATTFGAPAVFYGRVPEWRDLHGALVTQWIHEDDPVPGALGNWHITIKVATASLKHIGGKIVKGVASKLKSEDSEAWVEVVSQMGNMTVSRASSYGKSRVEKHLASYLHLSVPDRFWLRNRSVVNLSAFDSQAILSSPMRNNPSHHLIGKYIEAFEQFNLPRP
jgi:hypothetical protein